jgi:hypothetical protein
MEVGSWRSLAQRHGAGHLHTAAVNLQGTVVLSVAVAAAAVSKPAALTAAACTH